MRGLMVLSSLLIAALAQAQTSVDAEGEYHLRRAHQAIDLHAWQTAMTEFEAAAPVLTPQELEYELARCLLHLGREAEAISYYEHLARQNGTFAEASRARLAEIDELVYARLHPPRSLAPPLATGVGAVLTAGVGAVLVGSGLAPIGALNAIDCPAPCGTRRSLETRADVGYVFFGIAGAAAILDAFLWVRWKQSNAGPPPRHWEGVRF